MGMASYEAIMEEANRRAAARGFRLFELESSGRWLVLFGDRRFAGPFADRAAAESYLAGLGVSILDDPGV